MKLLPILACMLLSVVLIIPTRTSAADGDKLSGIFVAGQDWQVVAEGLGFADGLSCDADGNVFYCDLKGKPAAIWKVSPDGAKTKLIEAGRSGTKLGPDGKLYTVGAGQAVAYDLPAGTPTVLAEKLSTNDLAVSARGFLYLTETGKKQVTLIDPKTKEARAVDTGINKPNGIALSPDQKTLLVSDYGGVNVWSFRIQDDGTLADKKPLMTMKAPEKKPDVAGGDGMTVDSTGRAYVTTSVGLQIFAPTGELLGVLPKPQEAPLVSACFGGKDLDYLYVACGDKVYRRKTTAKGVLSFRPPGV